MIPAFHCEKHGYDKRQVDEFIDKTLAENKRVATVNDELYNLWVTRLKEIEPQYQTSQGQGFNDGAAIWEKLSALLEESSQLTQPAPAAKQEPEHHGEKISHIRSILFNVLFYTALVLVVLGVFLFSGANTAGPPQNLAGFTAMTVLTRSMQDVIPQDSVIITRQVDPNTIQVGDDITYLISNNVTVTHRVVAIHGNYAGTGMPGFETKGTMNERPDAEIVHSANVIGRVIFHNLILGRALLFIRMHVLWVGILAGLIIALSIALCMIFSKSRTKKAQKAQPEATTQQKHQQPKSHELDTLLESTDALLGHKAHDFLCRLRHAKTRYAREQLKLIESLCGIYGVESVLKSIRACEELRLFSATYVNGYLKHIHPNLAHTPPIAISASIENIMSRLKCGLSRQTRKTA